jgi:hypothetical protein
VTELENQLEFILLGIGRRDIPPLVTALDRLAANGLADAGVASAWRARLVRMRAQRTRPEPTLRAASLRLLDAFPPAPDDEDGDGATVARHLFGAGLITGHDLDRVVDRLTAEALEDVVDVPYAGEAPSALDPAAACRAPDAVALGPSDAAGGYRVDWIMTFADSLELGLRDVPPDPPSPRSTNIVLADGRGRTYRPSVSRFHDGYGHLRYPHPKVAAVELEVAGERLFLAVP